MTRNSGAGPPRGPSGADSSMGGEMKRRDFLSKSVLGGTAAAAATVLAAPAIAQQVIEWRMVHSWPKGLPGVGVGAGHRRTQTHAAGEK